MRIALLGDIALVGKYDLQQNPNAAARLSVMSEFLHGFDLVVANLESPLTTRTSSIVPKSMHIRSDPRNVDLLAYLGVHAVSLANNHINDFGRRGIDDTIAVLERSNIGWYGVDGRALTMERGGDRVSLSGFCCLSANGTGYQTSGVRGVGLLTKDQLIRQMSVDRDMGAFSVLSCHWGREHTHYPNPEHVWLMRSLEDVGPFLVHGHHPHVLQGVERRKDSLVAYSLGNCIFDDLESITRQWRLEQTRDNKRSMVLAVEIHDGWIRGHEAIGFEDADEGLVFRDVSVALERYVQGLDGIAELVEYEALRQAEVSAERTRKFGRKDLRWWLSRLNYYSIGSRLTALPRQRRYNAVRREFRAP